MVFDSFGHPRDVEFVLDTGFTGALTLPPAVIGALGLPWDSREQLVLGNGQIHEFDVHLATVIWDGAARPVVVQAADTSPLFGMGLLAGHDLRVRIAPGGQVEIEAVP